MSAFGRAFHSENEINPVFDDYLAKKLLTEEEYNSVAGVYFKRRKVFRAEFKRRK